MKRQGTIGRPPGTWFQKIISSWWFFTNPFEKYARQIGSFPQVEVDIKKYVKAPYRFLWGVNEKSKWENVDPFSHSNAVPREISVNRWHIMGWWICIFSGKTNNYIREMCELFHSLPGSCTLQENKLPHLVGHTKKHTLNKKKNTYIYIYDIFIRHLERIAGDRHFHQFWCIMAPKTIARHRTWEFRHWSFLLLLMVQKSC